VPWSGSTDSVAQAVALTWHQPTETEGENEKGPAPYGLSTLDVRPVVPVGVVEML